MKRAVLMLPLLAGLTALTACDQLGIEDPVKLAAAKEAEGKAVGSACRHALRAIEDCYTLNPKAHKAAVFAGWREMDEYMRENKLDGVVPVIPRPPGKGAEPVAGADAADEKASPATKDGGKDAAKPKAH